MDDGILSDYTELGWICLDDLELDGTHTSSDEESVTLADGAVS